MRCVDLRSNKAKLCLEDYMLHLTRRIQTHDRSSVNTKID